MSAAAPKAEPAGRAGQGATKPIRVALTIACSALAARIRACLTLDPLLDFGAKSNNADVVLADFDPGVGRTIALVLDADAGVVWRADVRAVLPVDVPALALRAAIHAVAAGLAVGSVARFQTGEREAKVHGPVQLSTRLTKREREVLELLVIGEPNKRIARRLGVSVATVKFHVAAILAKLGARGRSEAVAVALRLGLVML